MLRAPEDPLERLVCLRKGIWGYMEGVVCMSEEEGRV